MATASCPHCSKSLDVPDELAGETVRCASCQQTFTVPANLGIGTSGPKPSSANSDTGVTDKVPSPKSPEKRDSADLPTRRDRHEIANRDSSPWTIPLLIVGGIVVLGGCACGGPALFFFGGMGMFVAHRDEAVQVARVREADAVANMEGIEKVKVMRGFARGTANAQNAVANNNLLWKEYPPIPAPAWHGEYIKLLMERCKCDYQVIGGKLNKDEEDEIRGWNDVIRTELQRRHGNGILAELQNDAEKRWRERIEKKDK